MISHNAELLDQQEASYGLYRHVLKPGYDIFILHNKTVVRSKVRYADANIIETEHDFYYWNEHGKLWWLTRRGANDKR